LLPISTKEQGTRETVRISFARHWWLTPVILVIQEVAVRSQPGQIVCKTLSRKDPAQKKAAEVAQLVPD
jgi:hypothetical protein